jgi:23S rRNA (guanosine2251-2'-O)-methyltransferase
MNKSSFFIAGQHAVIEALRNPDQKGFKSVFN